MPAISYPDVPDMPTSGLAFSPAVIVGDLVLVSGQASVTATGEIVSGPFEEEMRRSIANLEAVLAGCGCTLADVVQTRNYVKDPADLGEFNRIYREYFHAPFPARTTLSHCLGRLKFELDAVAVRRPDG